MVDITMDSHTDGAGEGLEDAFDFVVLILSFSLDIEIHASCVAETLEEVEEHLGGHLPYPFAMKLSIPHEPGATTEVESY